MADAGVSEEHDADNGIDGVRDPDLAADRGFKSSAINQSVKRHPGIQRVRALIK